MSSETEIVFAYQAIGSRVSRTYAMRGSVAKIRASCTPAMLDAEQEIARVRSDLNTKIDLGRMDCKLSSINAGSPGAATTEDVLAGILDRVKRYYAWFDQCPPVWRSVAINVIWHGKTIRGLAQESGKSPAMISLYYRRALNDYCLYRGWGEQIARK